MNGGRAFLRLLVSTLRQSWVTALAESLLTLVPLLVGLAAWLSGAPTWLVFLITAASVPAAGFVVYTNARAVWAAEVAKRQEVEEELRSYRDARPSLRIVFEPRFPMWWPEECWLRVGVFNGGSAPAQNVEVRLEDMAPNPLAFNVLPSLLGRKGGSTSSCQINPGNTEYFDVVKGLRDDKDTLALWTVEGSGQTFALGGSPDHQSELLIRVTAGNADPAEERLTLQCRPGEDPNLRLHASTHRP